MKKRTATARIIRTALARADMTIHDLCRLAVIPVSTYMAHQRDERLTQQELRHIDKVLHLTDEELVQMIRG